MEFQELKDKYNSKSPICGRIGKIYSYRYNKVYDVGCGHWDCPKCRPRLKYWLYMELLRNIYSYGLDKHFIITFDGEKVRKKISWFDSYSYMNKNWVNFHKVINYHFGNISYVVLPRAQRSGYCHYHILVDKEIDWSFLDEKRKKYKFGYVWIHKNQSVAEYLSNDFFKDSEYYIPDKIRHYRTSVNIKLNKYGSRDDNIFFTPRCDMNTIERRLNFEFGRMLPFEYYLKKWWDINHKSVKEK